MRDEAVVRRHLSGSAHRSLNAARREEPLVEEDVTEGVEMVLTVLQCVSNASAFLTEALAFLSVLHLVEFNGDGKGWTLHSFVSLVEGEGL